VRADEADVDREDRPGRFAGLWKRSDDAALLAEAGCKRSDDAALLAQARCRRSDDAALLAEARCKRSQDVALLAQTLSLLFPSPGHPTKRETTSLLSLTPGS
jgi:hypothetical protein